MKNSHLLVRFFLDDGDYATMVINSLSELQVMFNSFVENFPNMRDDVFLHFQSELIQFGPIV